MPTQQTLSDKFRDLLKNFPDTLGQLLDELKIDREDYKQLMALISSNAELSATLHMRKEFVDELDLIQKAGMCLGYLWAQKINKEEEGLGLNKIE